MIHVQDLVKRFGDFTAVDDISFDVRAGRDLRLPRPERRRQDHHDQDADDAAATHQRRACASTASIPASTRHDVRRRFGIVFQDPSLDGELTA